MNETQDRIEQSTVKPPALPPCATDENEAIAAGGNALENLLKAPGALIWRINKDRDLPVLSVQLLFWGLVFHAVYGFAMALFGSSQIALMTAWKAPLIALCSLLLCIPSLYVFSCVAGMAISIRQAVALASTAVAMTGLLLLGLTPVTWLFSVSTNNLPFVVLINITAWSIAVIFAMKFFNALTLYGGLEKTTGLRWWLFVYIIVSLQMATVMRPLLGASEHGWHEPEKKFFLAHLKESITPAKEKPAPPANVK